MRALRVQDTPTQRARSCGLSGQRASIGMRRALVFPSLLGVATVAWGLPVIDMMTAHDEIPMLRYRLRLHAPIAVKTVILESSLSHAGLPKPLYVRDSLRPAELARYKIELIDVPVDPALRQHLAGCANSTSTRCTWVLEIAQRKFIMGMLQPMINRTMAELGLDDVLVHMSDLDELLDVDAVNNLSMPQSGCVSPKLRNFVYGERCPATYPPWSRSVLFRARSGWLTKHMSPSLQLRKLAKGQDCGATSRWLGWHFGYFMSTKRILHKLSNFAHAHDPFIKRITHGAEPQSEMDRRVRNCLDVHGRRYGPAWAAYDGKLPAEPGWPRNPVAPGSLNASVLERERRAHEAEASKASRHAASNPGALAAAMGKLASVKQAIANLPGAR